MTALSKKVYGTKSAHSQPDSSRLAPVVTDQEAVCSTAVLIASSNQ
jgi:hypothetical protein